MNFKTTYILFGIVVVLLATLGIALFMEPVSPGDSDYVLPSVHRKDSELKPEQVTHVEIARTKPDAETIVFERDADGKSWHVTKPYPLRADSFAVSGLIRDVLDAQRDPGADMPPSLKEFGLDPPGTVVTLSKDGREVKLNVGDVSAGTENQRVWVTSSDNAKQGLPVKKSRLESVFKKLNDFRDKTLLANSDIDIRGVKLSEAKKALELTKTSDANWKYVQPAYGVAELEGETSPGGAPPPANSALSGVRPLLTDLTNLRVEKNDDFVADEVADKDLGKYNLDPAKDAVLRVEVDKTAPAKDDDKKEEEKKEENKAGQKVVLLVGVGKPVDDKAPEKKYYARVEGEQSVVRVPAKDVDPLRKLLDDPGAVRDRNLVRFDNLKTPDAIQVQNGSVAFDLFHPEAKPWQLYRGDREVKADDKVIQDLTTHLTQKNLVRSFPETKDLASLGLDKPTAVVSLWVDGLAKEEAKKDEKKDDKAEAKKDEKAGEKKDEKAGEKKDEKKEEKKPAAPKLKDPQKPTVRLSFGRVDSNLVAVKREAGGETTLLKVPASVLELVQKGPLAYTERTLPKFNEGDPSQDVTKLVLTRGGVTTEITRDTKAASPAEAWKIDKPANLAGRLADYAAVDAILRVLNGLRATKLVSDKPEPEVVDREFGLKTPATKATVTLTKDGKTTTYDYEFGKDANATNVYARQGQRPEFVFEVDKKDLDSLSKDLRDPTFFRFDAAKAKTVKLTGWKDVTGSPTTVEFERKEGATWTAKTPPNFTVSSDKVNRLVSALSSGRAVKFLDRKLTQKEREDDGLLPEKGGLLIEVTVEGEKEPFILAVGNLDADKDAYLATANRLGDSLFTVRKDVFEKPKEKPAFFSP
jgi:hypothetical protein